MDWNKFIEGSIKFISDYLTDNNLDSMILGISGGIDSSIAAVLCSMAAKKTNTKLIGVSLMCSTNKESETTTADLIGNAFCNEYYVENIQEIYENVSKFCLNSPAVNGKTNNISEGNIKARLRMLYLWNLSGHRNGVTIDTDNRTEHEIGFFTVMGDQNYLNPGIIHLWKTEVYELVDYLINSESLTEDQKYALKLSKSLIPTDGNGVSNSDCEQFGLDNYEQVDDILKTMYFNEDSSVYSDNSEGYIRLIDSYNEQGVDKIMLLHQNTEFKRRQFPIAPTRFDLL